MFIDPDTIYYSIAAAVVLYVAGCILVSIRARESGSSPVSHFFISLFFTPAIGFLSLIVLQLSPHRHEQISDVKNRFPIDLSIQSEKEFPSEVGLRDSVSGAVDDLSNLTASEKEILRMYGKDALLRDRAKRMTDQKA